jgi:outer membrane protein insertion porin family
MSFLRAISVLLLTALIASAETRVRIGGSVRRSEAQLLDLLGDRLAHVASKPASASRADDAAFLLRQLMLKDGYAEVQVGWKILRRDEILLSVQEGMRRSLGTITLTGLPDEEAKKFANLYRSPAEKGRSIISGSAPFREEDVEKGLSNIRQELNAEGYWSAEVRIVSRDTDAATGVVNLSIHATPGVIHRIAPPRIFSPDETGIKETQAAVKPYIGGKATTANLNAMRLAVEQKFASSGYKDALIEMGRTLSPPQFIPQFTIDLGRRVKLREIRIDGLERTQPQRIAQRMAKLEGEWYDEAAMNQYLRGFLATGAFSSARVETSEVDATTINATLHFTEARAKMITLAAGFGSYQGLITRVTYADRNLLGQLLGFSTGFEFSSRGVLGETKLTDPWLFGSDVAATARVFALIYGREGYRTFETGLDGKLTRKFGDHYTLDFLAGTSLVNVTNAGIPTADLGETVYAHPKLRLTQSIDFRDSPILPTRGWHLESPFEIGAAIGDTSTSYVQAGLTGGWYHPLGKNYRLGIGGECGMILPSGDDENLPIDLRLFNGGSRSVRSFPERGLGPTSANGDPLGGETMWNTNVELSRNLTGALSVVAFFDAGSLSQNHRQLSSAAVEMAVGLGLRLDLPIGPVRLEYGHSLTQDPGEPSGTFHFAIGFAY